MLFGSLPIVPKHQNTTLLPIQVLISLVATIAVGLALAGTASIYHWFIQPGSQARARDNWTLTPSEINDVKGGLVLGLVSA